MALGDNLAFLNETTFGLADEQTSTTGVSGMIVSNETTAKVLFNKEGTLQTHFATVSAKIDDVVYELDIDNAYFGKELAIINGDRIATQFTFTRALTAGSNLQTLSAQGTNSVGPTLRRLYHLGYV